MRLVEQQTRPPTARPPWRMFARGGETTIAGATGGLAAAVLLWLARKHWLTGMLAAAAGGLWLAILYFFRDPDRNILYEPGVFLSPGDGTVVHIAREREEQHLKTDTLRISLFLSVLDVHVQRAPCDGRVETVTYRAGKFLQAFKPEASQVNEAISTVLETEHGRILVRQVAGILARRCVNYLQPGNAVRAGQRFGLIRFGSRIDLFLPPDAEVLVAVGDKARGGITPLARLEPDNR